MEPATLSACMALNVNASAWVLGSLKQICCVIIVGLYCDVVRVWPKVRKRKVKVVKWQVCIPPREQGPTLRCTLVNLNQDPALSHPYKEEEWRGSNGESSACGSLLSPPKSQRLDNGAAQPSEGYSAV